MTCDRARDALVEAELPIRDDSSELATHLRECARCARLVVALTRDVGALRSQVQRRVRRRRRVAIVAAAASALAATIAIAVVRMNTRAAITPPPPINVMAEGVVSVDVPQGKTAIVIRTKDPKVTVVWLSNAGGGL